MFCLKRNCPEAFDLIMTHHAMINAIGSDMPLAMPSSIMMDKTMHMQTCAYLPASIPHIVITVVRGQRKRPVVPQLVGRLMLVVLVVMVEVLHKMLVVVMAAYSPPGWARGSRDTDLMDN